METEKQYTALDYADLLDAGCADDHGGDIAAELRRLHDRVVELEAMLDAVGAAIAAEKEHK